MNKKIKKRKNKKTDSLARSVLSIYQNSPTKTYNYKEVAKKIQAEGQSVKDQIQRILKQLANQGSLIEVYTGKFKLKSNSEFAEGIVDRNQHGAYIICDNIEKDIFVSPNKIKNALHGDRVKIHIYPKRKDRRLEGEIVEIIKRAKTEFVGIIEINDDIALFRPDNSRLQIKMIIPFSKLLEAKDGEKVIAEITEWPPSKQQPYGRVIKVLGKPGDNEVEINSIMLEYGLPMEFTEDVEREAANMDVSITEKEIKKRRDFRNTTTFTIDPDDAKDFDDALSLKKLENGNFEVGVHIADVTHYLLTNSIIDKEAVSRATSVYLVDRVIPMLPELLSNNVCSLRPNEDRLCFSAVFEINNDSQIINSWFGKTIINSDKRFTYDEAQSIIEAKEGLFSEELQILDRLAKLLRDKRYKSGAILFERDEIKIRIDEKGVPTGVYKKILKDSNKLIEEFMLLANRKVAEYIGNKNKKVGVYRVHDLPNHEKLIEFASLAKRFGYNVNFDTPKQIVKSLNNLLEEIKGKAEENIINIFAIKSMAKAFYTTENIGHFGLAFKDYTHFTSPIRRYPDVMVHRILNDYLEGKPIKNQAELEKLCKHSSDMERKAANAERDSVKFKQVEFLKDKIGEEYDGMIVDIAEWGIYVELIENNCEGMVRFSDIRDDYYIFDKNTYTATNRNGETKYQVGDKVRVTIKRADIMKKQIDLTFVK